MTLKKIAVSVLRAAGFIGLFAGGYLAFVYSFSGAFKDSFAYWALFFASIAAIFWGDLLQGEA